MYKELKSKGLSQKKATIKLFSVALYILLKNDFKKLSSVYIDQEYQGHEYDIKTQLINLLVKAKFEVDKKSLHFIKIGKKSSAHALALDTLRHRKKPDLIITEKQLTRELNIRIKNKQ